MEAEEFPLEELEEIAEEPLSSSVYPPDNKADELLGEGIKKLISKKSTPHMKELVEDLIDEWGGARQIAKALYQTYNAAPQGSMTRSRILDRVISFIQANTDDKGDDEFDDKTLVAVMLKEMRNHGYAPIGPEAAGLQLPGETPALPSDSDDPGDSGS